MNGGWRQLSDDEERDFRRSALDCSNLSTEGCEQVRQEFRASGAQALKTLANHLGRCPTQAEADEIHAKLAQWFNEERIPLLAPGTVH